MIDDFGLLFCTFLCCIVNIDTDFLFKTKQNKTENLIHRCCLCMCACTCVCVCVCVCVCAGACAHMYACVCVMCGF